MDRRFKLLGEIRDVTTIASGRVECVFVDTLIASMAMVDGEK
jgi:hypothetical protein